MAVPMAQAEFEYARERGTEALQDRLEQSDIESSTSTGRRSSES